MFYSLYSGLHALYGMKERKSSIIQDGAVTDFHLYILKWTHISFLSIRFLDLGTVDILGKTEFVVRSCPVHCTMFSSIPGLYPLDASSIPLPQ